MHLDQPQSVPPTAEDNRPWYKTLTRYHWFVLTVAALGWLFDTMDQQLFNLARMPAMKALVTNPDDEPSVSRAKVNEYGGYATSIFLIGWATGGLTFGVLGDRIGRAKTMLLTILLYSLFTGLSALSRGFWDFALYRFLTGLGVGGEFAVGVSLVAEVMPDKARPFALGLLQALSAIGNITAALISIVLGKLEEAEVITDYWRIMFLIGTVPAFLCLFMFRRLKEPERWQALKKAAREGTSQEKLGSLAELFGDSRWRKRALIGMLMSASGIIGLWAIGFYSFDLNRYVFSKTFENDARGVGEARKDLEFIQLLVHAAERGGLEQKSLDSILRRIQPSDLLNLQQKSKDVQPLYQAIQQLNKKGVKITSESLATEVQNAEAVAALARLQPPPPDTPSALESHETRIVHRSREMAGRLNLWAGITSVMLNLGAALGIYFFTRITHFTGRKPAFAIAYLLAMLSTAWVFWFLDSVTDVFWMIPIMGFCQLSLFGGYAIYFPELFPTRLRSTGVSFCYNIARYVAAVGPSMLGLLSSQVFSEKAGFEEPMRYAGLTMCAVFLVGLCALPFAPETKGKPLPE
jgi:MFS family permease